MNIAIEKAHERKDHFSDFLTYSTSQIHSLSESYFLKTYLKEPQNKELKKNINEYMLAFSQANQDYMQVRYIDKLGNEIVRVDRDTRYSKPYLVHESRLQNKAHRYYFENAINLPKAEVCYSALDLNVEKGVLQKPYVPTLRVGSPVYVDGLLKGVVVINYFMKDFLDNVVDTQFFDATLFNNKGEILIGKTEQSNWSAYDKNKEDIKSLYSDDFQNILDNMIVQDPDFIAINLNMPMQDELFLLLTVKDAHLLKEKVDTQERYLFSFLSLILTIGVFSFLVSFNVSKFYKDLNIVRTLNKKLLAQQEKMIHQSRLASMGDMISMIAHQWRQPLNSLSLVLQLLQTKYTNQKLTQRLLDEYIDKSMNFIDNMSQTIDNFMYFFKPNKEKVYFNIKKTIIDTLKLIEMTLKNTQIDIELDINEKVFVYGYDQEFSQVILNLLKNAYDALNEQKIENKKITIKINHEDEDEDVIVEISDNAKGIKEEILNKIFDPYFTTKDQLNGTGLGLYMSKMIIEENMEGELLCHNTQEGACFTIILPNIKQVQSKDHD